MFDQPTISDTSEPHPFARRLTWIFNDHVMGAVAIGALAIALAPVVFPFSRPQFDIIEILQWIIVTLFAADYLLYFYLAADKRAFLLNPWRIVDLATVVLPVLTLIPAIDDSLRHTLVLRLLRLARAFSFGLRATPWMLGHHHVPVVVPASAGVPKSFTLDPDENFATLSLPWPEFLAALSSRSGDWYDVYDLGAAHLEALHQASGIPAALLLRAIGPRNFPHIETTAKRLVITSWLPAVTHGPTAEITRHNVLLAVLEEKVVLTISVHGCDLRGRIIARLREDDDDGTAVLTQVLAFFRVVLDHNEEALSCVEGYVRGMEEVPMAKSGTGFFQLGFRMRKDLAQIGSDLWRIKGILGSVNDERIRLPWVPDDDEIFKIMSLQAEFLYETASNLRENLISLLELHMNTVSFQMNRLMKLLAVVTALGLIPATVGGLLGMNVLGTPWPITLPQVIFIVVLTVVITLYTLLLSGTLD